MKKLYAILPLLTLFSFPFCQALDKKFYITDNEVINVVPHGNTIYLGGRFTVVGPNTGHAALLDNTTGVWDENMPNINGEVDAIVTDGSGGWYVGGYFSYVGDININNLIHIKADKTVDNNFKPQPDQAIDALVMYNNTLYAGGKFNNIAGQPKHRAAAFNINTGNLTAWNPEPDNWVTSMAAHNGLIYLLGNFGNAGGQPRPGLAAVDAVTGNANNFLITQNSSSGISAMAILGDTIYLGGNFTMINGQPRNELGAIDVNTGITTSWAPTADNLVSTVYANNGKVFIGGAFDLVNGANHLGLAALDAVTGAVSPWNAQVTGYNAVGGNVYSMVAVGDTLYLAGHFKSVSGQACTNLAAIDINTGVATNWLPQANNNAYSIATDGLHFYTGGEFTSVNTQARSYLAALDAKTGKVTPWAPQLDGNVHGLAVKGDTVIVGGEFFNIGDSSRKWLASIDSATGIATGWNPGVFGRVYSIDISGNTVYVAGTFSHVGGADKYDVAALDGDDGTAKPWSVDLNQSLNTVISGIKVNNKNVYIWGAFTSVGTATRNNLAELDTTSGEATSWNPAPNGPVKALLISGNNVYAGGSFTNIGGQPRNNIALLDRATGNAADWNPNISGGYVGAIALFNGIIYAGGTFTGAGGIARNNITAIDAVTGNITGWNPGTDYAPIDVIIPFQSSIIFGGNFTHFAYYSVSNFAVVGTAITLPLQLLDFSAATQNNNIIKLNWSTSNEVNTDHFTLQRSGDGVNFADIADITANGKNFNAYTYTDGAFKTGNVLYYRLKMVDKDGSFTYSKTITINIRFTAQAFVIYPNPVHNKLGLNITSLSNQKAALMILDMNGKIIHQQYIQLYTGPNNISILLNIPVQGIYIAELRVAGKKFSCSFLAN